jgi:hypothetical protein
VNQSCGSSWQSKAVVLPPGSAWPDPSQKLYVVLELSWHVKVVLLGHGWRGGGLQCRCLDPGHLSRWWRADWHRLERSGHMTLPCGDWERDPSMTRQSCITYSMTDYTTDSDGNSLLCGVGRQPLPPHSATQIWTPKLFHLPASFPNWGATLGIWHHQP